MYHQRIEKVSKKMHEVTDRVGGVEEYQQIADEWGSIIMESTVMDKLE